jgi:N utilization substance protein B
MTKAHRRPRVRAFRALFEAEFGGGPALIALDRTLADANVADDQRAYARTLVNGVTAHCEVIDTYIAQYAPAWPVDQIAPVDRIVLRIALYELLFNNAAVPIGMAINEAVELAKTYGSEASSRFINGVLGTVSRQCLPEPSPRETETEREPETEESRGPV